MRIKKKCPEIRINEKWLVQRDKQTLKQAFLQRPGDDVSGHVCIYKKKAFRVSHMGQGGDKGIHKGLKESGGC